MRTAALSAIVLSFATAAHADIITQWDFNQSIGVNNSPVPSFGAGSATPVGMTNNANNADHPPAGGNPTSTDPTLATNRAWRVRGSVSNGWSGTTQLLSGARFNASTVGFTNIAISMDVFATDGSPRHAQFQYTLDGSSFTSFGGLLDFNATNDAWRNSIVFDLSSIPGANNNPSFGFKLVSAFSPVQFTNVNGVQPANTAFQRANAGPEVYTGGAGNYRFDMVTFIGTVPTPGAAALLGLAGLVAARRKR